jgi:hypothetical protein
VASMIGSILGCRPTEPRGDLVLPNYRKLLRMLLIERSIHCASFTICDVVNLVLLHIMDNRPTYTARNRCFLLFCK